MLNSKVQSHLLTLGTSIAGLIFACCERGPKVEFIKSIIALDKRGDFKKAWRFKKRLMKRVPN